MNLTTTLQPTLKSGLINMYMHVCMSVHVYAYMYECMYVCRHVLMFGCMYIHI